MILLQKQTSQSSCTLYEPVKEESLLYFKLWMCFISVELYYLYKRGTW